ncbi:phage tail tube protein [Solidesulfovibrio sp.]
MAVESQLTRRAAILVAPEETYGTAVVPDPLTHGVLINNGVEITPQADRQDRDIVRDTFTPAGSVVGAKSLDIAIKTEFRGGGLDGTGKPKAPDYGNLLLACGMQAVDVVRLALGAGGAGTFVVGEEISGGTSNAHAIIDHIERDNLLVVRMTTGVFTEAETISGITSAATAPVGAIAPGIMYRPITAAPSVQKSGTIYFHRDGILHSLVGARGTVSLDAQVGKIPILDFKMSGLWVDPQDAAIPAPVLTNLAGPQFLAADLRIGEYEPVFTALKFDLGNKIERRQDANSVEGVVGLLITGRSPSGSLDPEVDKLASFNPWAAWKDTNARARINGYVGSTPGNRAAIHMGACQYTDLKYGDRVGLATYAMGFLPTQDGPAGDTEFRLTFF